MGKPRYQKGSLELKGAEWTGRYLEYYEKPDKTMGRVHKRVFLGTLVEFPTKSDAQQKLSQILERINSKFNVKLERLAAADIALADKGAIGELMVSIDLMHRGYDVFRNQSPTGPVDLMALKDRKVYRIQVKRRYSEKGFSLPMFTKLLDLDYDVLAIVTGDGDVKYYTNSSDFQKLESNSLPQICPTIIKTLEVGETQGKLVN